MGSITFACKYCRRLTPVTYARLNHARVVRCDACYSVNSITENQREALLAQLTSSKRLAEGTDRLSAVRV
jgi:hypothetical protein